MQEGEWWDGKTVGGEVVVVVQVENSRSASLDARGDAEVGVRVENRLSALLDVRGNWLGWRRLIPTLLASLNATERAVLAVWVEHLPCLKRRVRVGRKHTCRAGNGRWWWVVCSGEGKRAGNGGYWVPNDAEQSLDTRRRTLVSW